MSYSSVCRESGLVQFKFSITPIWGGADKAALKSLAESASHNEDPGVIAFIGFSRFLPGRGRAMAAPEVAQLRVVHGCRRIARPRGGLRTGTVSKRLCSTGGRPKHLSAAGSRVYFPIGRQFPAIPNERHVRVLYHCGPDGDYIALRASGRTAAHEYVHAVLHHSAREIPVWFKEGIAEFYSTIQFRGR